MKLRTRGSVEDPMTPQEKRELARRKIAYAETLLELISARPRPTQLFSVSPVGLQEGETEGTRTDQADSENVQPQSLEGRGEEFQFYEGHLAPFAPRGRAIVRMGDGTTRHAVIINERRIEGGVPFSSLEIIPLRRGEEHNPSQPEDEPTESGE